MKISLLSVGRPRGAIAEVIELYEKRIPHYFSWETVEVREAAGRGLTAAQVMQDEGARLLARLSGAGKVIALDRLGTMWSSERLANWLDESAVRGVPGATFIIGGAFGLSPAVLERVDEKISFSPMTFPHEVARLLLVEQLYRAGTILRGEPYHKGKGS